MQFIDRDWDWRLSMVDKNSVEWTADSGQSWSKPIAFGENIYQRSLVFVNRDRGWVLGERKVMKTNDRGRHWREEHELMGLSLQFPTFLDGDHIWLASQQGTIANSIDGGEHWNVSHDLPKNITDIFFTSPTLGWAVGENGLIAHTEDGGLHWRKQEISLPYDENRKQHPKLMDIFFINQAGWICGDNGLILRTIDGGSSWTIITSITKEPLVSIRFVDEFHGWAVGGFPEPAVPRLSNLQMLSLKRPMAGRLGNRRISNEQPIFANQWTLFPPASAASVRLMGGVPAKRNSHRNGVYIHLFVDFESKVING